jgi:hypothetical protein
MAEQINSKFGQSKALGAKGRAAIKQKMGLKSPPNTK